MVCLYLLMMKFNLFIPLIKNIEIYLQNSANSLINFCKANRMVPSADKTKVMLIASSKRFKFALLMRILPGNRT